MQSAALRQRLALQALSGDDVAAALHRAPEVQEKVLAVLWHRATHSYQTGDCSAAKELFAAAFQFSRPEARSKTARALAACHAGLGLHQRAAEYLDIAGRHEAQPSSFTQLLRLQALAHTGDTAQVLGEGGKSGRAMRFGGKAGRHCRAGCILC